MFLKHRNWLTWLLCLSSALLLSLGAFSVSGEGLPFSTTAPGVQGTSYAVTEPTAMTSPFPTVVSTSTQEQPQRSLAPYLRAAALLAGAALGLWYVLLRPKGATLGPEGALLVLLLLPRGLTVGLQLLVCWAILAGLLAAVRELLWWCFGRFPLNHSLSHRLGQRLTGEGVKMGYLLCQVLTCGGALAVGTVLLLWRQYWVSLPFFLAALLAVLCAAGLGRDLDRLTAGIRDLHDGREITVGTGNFEAQETQLAALRTQIDEAVHKAVTGERFKVELISNVSHDLRTPLTAILGYGELLESESLSQDGRQHLEQLNKKAGYMRDLVESLFELTKVSSGVEAGKRERIDLIRLLEQTIGLFDDRLHEAQLQVRRHYCADSLPVVTDGARMHQVFANLLGNAIKYALPGTRIHLEVTNGEQVTVRMTNIASYEMDFAPEEILQRFARGDKARSTEGSGIGLAIAQTYTESVGGSFRIAIDGDQFSAITQLPKTERVL